MQIHSTGGPNDTGHDTVEPAATSTHTAVEGYATAGPHARPIVVMLGLFSCCGCTVSAVMIEGTKTIWLDLITNGGRHTQPLAAITGITSDDPTITIESRYRDWADYPEIHWHLKRETALLYRTYLDDRNPPAARHPCPSPQPRNCLEPSSAQVVWRQGE